MAKETLRPKFHFTPRHGWMNDPNGLFYLNGVYHLYFQYYPKDIVWGPMHWGHATSKDLITWTEHEIVLFPDEKGYIFSGCIVVDKANTSGFGTKDTTAIVAIFTYHDPIAEANGKKSYQTQGLAYSLDGGFTFTKFSDNPIIENPGLKDFRDPKIIWDKARNKWLMVVSTYAETFFYTSNNLIDWEYKSRFGKDIGAHGGVWECPDIFPLQIKDSYNHPSETKWILVQSLNPGGANGGSGTQYFVGDFDGSEFQLDANFKDDLLKNGAFWLDHGKDNYASVSWSNIPDEDGRRIIIGWMSNWHYADKTPEHSFRGKMTLPRTLNLKKSGNNYKLISEPVSELKDFTSNILRLNNKVLEGTLEIADKFKTLNSSLIIIEIAPIGKGCITIVLSNDIGEQLTFGLDRLENVYFIDKTKSGLTSFSEQFSTPISTAPTPENLKSFELSAIVDEGSIEVFINKGQTVMTEIVFNTKPFSKITLCNTSTEKTVINKFVIDSINLKSQYA